MGMRYRKSINLGGGVRLNLNKKSIGVSAGSKHLRYTVNSAGRRTSSVGVPGTGVSWRQTSSSSGATRRRGGTVRAAGAGPGAGLGPVKPGVFAPKAEKVLYRSLQAALAQNPPEQWAPGLEQCAADARYGVAARVLAGLFLVGGDPQRAFAALSGVLRSGVDPGGDAFLVKYAAGLSMDVSVSGVQLSLPIGRDLIALLVAQLHEQRGELDLAADAGKQMSESRLARVVQAGLAAQTGQAPRAVALTEGVHNVDDLATLALVMRAAAMRELGNFTAALEVLKEALRFPSRSPDVRHRARYERALIYLAQGQKRKAREELERIYAENSSLPHVNQALGELNG